MRYVSVLASILIAAIIFIAMPRLAEASPRLVSGNAGESITANYTKCLEPHRPGETCGSTNCTETCPSGCLHVTGECCVSGAMLVSLQKTPTLVAFLVLRHEFSDSPNGLDPEALPQPP